MQLKQAGDVILFGRDDHTHKLSTKRGSHFKAADVEAARADLLAEYSDEAETIDRYAARLHAML